MGCAQAVSRYSSIVQMTLVLLKGTFSDVMMQHCYRNAGPLYYPGLTIENTIQPTICGSHIHF